MFLEVKEGYIVGGQAQGYMLVNGFNYFLSCLELKIYILHLQMTSAENGVM